MIEKSLKKALIWYLLLNKRLLKKTGFFVILLLIPILALLMTNAAENEDSGFMRIAIYYGENNDDKNTAELLSGFNNEASDLFHYTVCKSEEEAVSMVASSKADAAWVFADDLLERIDDYAAGSKDPFVKIYETEENTLLKLSREKIYSTLYPHISYRLYCSYIDEELRPDFEIPEDARYEAYKLYENDDSIIAFEYLSSAEEKAARTTNYLTSPMSGMFAILMLLCGLASTMYYINDEKNGTFDWLTPRKKLLVLWTSNFCAVTIAAIFSTIALILSGNYTNFGTETVMMLLYILASASFCTLVGAVIPSRRAFGIIIPIVLIGCLVFCPIFFDLSQYRIIQLLLPPYYYLFGRFDLSYSWRILIYLGTTSVLAYGVYLFKNRKII